jgi:hypothetical protein
MNAALTVELTDKEISEALFQMGPTKALAQMGFRPFSIKDTGLF